ncbi:MAG: peptidoglycan editing factor PgeF [Burkholderiaceae bacterium]|nr:MAG: peptidoglycan editing factor PgeF [Burkholderiaceae bacterium]
MATLNPAWIVPDWPTPPRVRALVTTRNGGFSHGPYGGIDDGGMNLGDNTQDDPALVQQNKALLRQFLPSDPVWLQQVHGTTVLRLPLAGDTDAIPVADAVFTTEAGVVCLVRTADCLPVLLADRGGGVVGAAHAGWRGLAAGVIENTVAAMRSALPQADLIAWLGPAIGQPAYEVGDEVRAAFMAVDAGAARCFQARSPGKWLVDLAGLARQRLQKTDVDGIFGGEFCTFQDRSRFYSYRRDRETGRMASCIWLESF